MRLCIQKLCKELGEFGKDINEVIKKLVNPEEIQQALDIVRVVGNNAVHPGFIDVKDNPEPAARLFGLINMIAEMMITRLKKTKQMFVTLPEGIRAAITKRDGVNPVVCL